VDGSVGDDSSTRRSWAASVNVYRPTGRLVVVLVMPPAATIVPTTNWSRRRRSGSTRRGSCRPSSPERRPARASASRDADDRPVGVRQVGQERLDLGPRGGIEAGGLLVERRSDAIRTDLLPAEAGPDRDAVADRALAECRGLWNQSDPRAEVRRRDRPVVGAVEADGP
jgi:hypothetical protein